MKSSWRAWLSSASVVFAALVFGGCMSTPPSDPCGGCTGGTRCALQAGCTGAARYECVANTCADAAYIEWCGCDGQLFANSAGACAPVDRRYTSDRSVCATPADGGDAGDASDASDAGNPCGECARGMRCALQPGCSGVARYECVTDTCADAAYIEWCGCDGQLFANSAGACAPVDRRYTSDRSVCANPADGGDAGDASDATAADGSTDAAPDAG